MNKQLFIKITASIIVFTVGVGISHYLVINHASDAKNKSMGVPELFEVVPVLVEDPKLKLDEAVTEINHSQISYSLKKSEKGFELTVEALVPYSPEQEGIKRVFGVGSASSGNVVFDIQKK